MTFIRKHLMITATLAVGCVVFFLLAVGQSGAAQLLASVFAGGAAMARGAAMIRDMVHGRWGVGALGRRPAGRHSNCQHHSGRRVHRRTHCGANAFWWNSFGTIRGRQSLSRTDSAAGSCPAVGAS